MSETLLRVCGLRKRVSGAPVLDGLELSLEEGRIYALLGDPGSGKTTFLRCVAGLMRPEGGEMELLGCRGAELRKARRELGLLVDAPALYGDLNVVDNMLLQARLLGKVDKKRIGKLLKALAITPRETGRRRAGTCPESIKHRLGIALALLGEPRLALLDEAYSGLDTDDAARFHALVETERQERGLTLLLTGQFFSELYPLCTDFLFMEKGRITVRFTKNELAARLPEGIAKPAEYEAFYRELRKEAASA